MDNQNVNKEQPTAEDVAVVADLLGLSKASDLELQHELLKRDIAKDAKLLATKKNTLMKLEAAIAAQKAKNT